MGRSASPPLVEPHAAPIVRLAFALDGKSIAGGNDAGGRVISREPGGNARLERVVPVGKEEAVLLVEPWSPDRWLVVAPGMATIWDDAGSDEPEQVIWRAQEGQAATAAEAPVTAWKSSSDWTPTFR